MRNAFLLLGACVLIAACSNDLVTAPTPDVATAAKVTVRGVSSVRGSSPLIIVDGVVVGFNGINSGDIESVEIVKGAAATALYAAPMRCPAIVITTRRTPNASLPQRRSIGASRVPPTVPPSSTTIGAVHRNGPHSIASVP